ncbi:hypothetical protein [Uliginosibacterium sp. H1]|uniref:hypothetical protein n=1 Tax=Uliginosibacterium sp. H1 TaxID=3114757 RepID=UPI002E172970|nr:hypothetical protein [Uliginosibacterium sp. H1]
MAFASYVARMPQPSSPPRFWLQIVACALMLANFELLSRAFDVQAGYERIRPLLILGLAFVIWVLPMLRGRR